MTTSDDQVVLRVRISREIYDRIRRLASVTNSDEGEIIAKGIALMEIAVQESRRSPTGNITVAPSEAIVGSINTSFGTPQADSQGTATVSDSEGVARGSMSDEVSATGTMVGTEITGL